MTQQPENKTLPLEEILKNLRIQADQMPPSPTSARYRHALRSLISSVSVVTPQPCVPHLSDKPAAGLSPDETHTASPNTLSTFNLQLTTALTDWLVDLWLAGTPFSTASLYLDIISSLYGSAVRAGQLPKTDLFKELKITLKTLGQKGWTGGIDDEIFERALRLTKNAACLVADDAIAADLVLWSLTHHLMPLTDIALLKREDLMEGRLPSRPPKSEANSPQSEAGLSQVKQEHSGLSSDAPLVAQKTKDSLFSVIFNNLSLRNARRRYIFPLRQGERTEQQLKRHISKIVNALFKRARLPQATDPYQTVEALWAYAALRMGIPASALVSYLDYLHPGQAPLGLPILKLYGAAASQPPVSVPSQSSAGLSSGETTLNTEDLRLKTKDLAAIGRVFLENPPRWYALSLRPGVRFTQLCRRLELLSNTSSSNVQRQTYNIPLFYPCEEITRAIGKKIVVRERPFIRSVVFFQAKLTDIGRLFARIGDLAWCYRQSARPGAPYADISQRQFQLFQQTIARFTPDYEVASTGELELKPNDRVQIVGGLFAGHEASFDSVANGSEADTPTVYRLNIIGDNGIEWRISVDSRLATHKTNYLE